MQDLNDKITGNTLTATEWNEVPSEIQNVIEKTGQALSGADLDQLGKGIAVYAAGGDFYTDGGAADAYVLTVVGTKKAPAVYFDGMRVRFKPTNTNTGASTVNVASLGVKNIKIRGGGDPLAGDLTSGETALLRYDNAAGYFILENPVAHLEIGGGANLNQLNVHENSSFASYARFTNTTTGNTSGDGSAIGIDNDENLALVNLETTNVDLYTAGQLRLSVKSGGNVNIGGTHDTNRLMVHQGDSGSCYEHFTNTTTGVTGTDGLAVGINGSEQAIFWNYENTDMYIATNNAVRLVIAADGGIYTNGATGGSKGVDSINASQYYGNGYLMFDDTPPTGWDQGGCPVIDNDVGVDVSEFDIDAVIGGAFESIGPTGSGATNIWTAMNDIPASTRFVILRLHCAIEGNVIGTTYINNVYGRGGGSAVGVGNDTWIARATTTNSTGGFEQDRNINTHILPLDANLRFELTFSSTGGNNFVWCHVVGWL